MPTENPTPPSIFAEIETALHALHIYGAAGLAAFGWAMGWLLETAARPWVPLWFCGGLLIDNADRLRRDPADAVNVPARTAASARYRTASRIALTLALVLGGGALGYSIPILGFRWSIIDLSIYSFDQRSRVRRPLAPQAGSSVPRSHHGSAQGVPQKKSRPARAGRD